METYRRMDGFKSPAGWLPVQCTPGSAPGPTLDNEYGRTLPFFADKTGNDLELNCGLRESAGSGLSVILRPVLRAAAAAAVIRRRCRHHKGGTVLRLATVGTPSTRRRINLPRRVRSPGVSCLRIRYRLAPATGAPICYQFLRTGADVGRRRLMDAARRVRGTAARHRAGKRPVRTIPGAAGRSLAVTRCYINVLLKTDGEARSTANEQMGSERCVERSATTLSAASRLG